MCSVLEVAIVAAAVAARATIIVAVYCSSVAVTHVAVAVLLKR